MVGAHGEIPSAAAVLVLLGGGALYAHRLDEADLPGARRWLLGVAVSVVALQVVGQVDLSETTRIWSFGWAADISDPSSGAWRGSQHLDHVLAMAVLTFAWFRGVALGNSDLADRSLAQLVPLAAIVFVVGFLAGDAAQIVDRVRIAALAFLAVALLAVAFRNAQRLAAQGSFGAVGLTFVSTLGAMLVVAIVFMLIVTLLVAAVGGSGIAEPVTDALGWLLRIVATGVAWVVWTLLWPLRQLVGSGAPPLPPQEICFLNEAGELECVSELERDLDLEPNTGDDPLGAVVFRVFAGIGLVLGLTILAALLFRQVWRRRRTPDEERESLWDEADPLGDLWSRAAGAGAAAASARARRAGAGHRRSVPGHAGRRPAPGRRAAGGAHAAAVRAHAGTALPLGAAGRDLGALQRAALRGPGAHGGGRRPAAPRVRDGPRRAPGLRPAASVGSTAAARRARSWG